MRIGKLRNLVRIERPVTAANDEETVQTGWEPVCNAWADIAYLSGIETIKSGVPVSVARASVQIRYRPDIAANMRIVHGSTVYDIKSVLPDEGKHVYLNLAVEQGQNLG